MVVTRTGSLREWSQGERRLYISKTLPSILPGIGGLHCKIAAWSGLYPNVANEKNIYFDPGYLSGLSRARLRFFPSTFLEIAVYYDSIHCGPGSNPQSQLTAAQETRSDNNSIVTPG